MKRLWIVVGFCIVGLGLFFALSSSKQAQEEGPQPNTKPQAPQEKKKVPTRTAPPRSSPESDFIEDDPIGDMQLSGQVVDEEGRGVSGAVVHLFSHPPREVVTGEQGWFSLDRLVGRLYWIEARQEDELGSAQVYLTPEALPVTITLRKQPPIQLLVVDERDRAPISKAEISWGEPPYQQRATTDTNGRATLRGVENGTYLYTSAPGYGAVVGQVQSGSALEQTIFLQKGVGVSGVVVGPDGALVSGALVKIVREGSSPSSLLLRRLSSDAQGRWSIEALSSGTYHLEACHAKLSCGLMQTISIDGETPREGIVLSVEAGATLQGKVVTAQGTPEVGVMVVARSDITKSPKGSRSAYTDKNGAFRMEGLPRVGVVVSAVSGDGLGAAYVWSDLSRGEGEVTLVIEETGFASGLVVDAEGAPLSGVKVYPMPDLTGDEDLLSMQGKLSILFQMATTTDADGRFTVYGLEENARYSLLAEYPGMSAERKASPKIKAGEKEIKIVLRKKGSLTGKVQFKDGAAPSSFTVGTYPFEGTLFSTSDGSFVLPELAPGRVTLYFSGLEFPRTEKEVEVTSGAPTDLGVIVVERGRTVTGQVLSNGKPVPGATVVIGASVGPDSLTSKLWPRAVTDKEGRFRLSGLASEELTALAGHPEHGQSQGVSIPEGAQDASIELILMQTGSLEGVITYGGKPVQGSISVSAVDSGVYFSASCDASGRYRIEALPPGEYKVTASNQASPFQPDASNKHTKTLIQGGRAQTLHLEIPVGVKIVVSTSSSEDIYVLLALGSYAAKDPEELFEKIDALSEDEQFSSIVSASRSSAFSGVVPGAYTLCSFLQREFTAKGRITCTPVVIAASPETQTFSVTSPDAK